MLNFTNSYSITASEDRSNVIITFAQAYPAPFTDASDENNLTQEHISSFVLDGRIALSLADSILDLFDDGEIDNESDDGIVDSE